MARDAITNIVVNDSECQVGEVRVNYKHKVEVEVHPALSCVSYKQIILTDSLWRKQN